MIRFKFVTRKSNGHNYKIAWQPIGCPCGCGRGTILMIACRVMRRVTPIERRETRAAIHRYAAEMATL